MRMLAQLAVLADCTLGEGPVWLADRKEIAWVDIKQSKLHRYSLVTGEHKVIDTPAMVTSMHPGPGRRLFGTTRHGFAWIDIETGEVEPVADVESDLPGNRFNDGKVAPDGSYYAGSMDDDERDRTGSLYRMNRSMQWTKVDTGYCITNGPAFPLDKTFLYHTDTLDRIIYRIEKSGAGMKRSPFVSIDASMGYPDGMTVDAEDHLWVCHFGGNGLTRFDPDGNIVGHIAVPASNVTSCCFGGESLDTLYITTATKGLCGNERQRQPLAGSLFQVHLPVGGVPASRFGEAA